MIETLGSLPEMALEEKGMAEKGRRFDKNGKKELVESAKNSTEMLYSRCENFAEVAKSIPAHHHTMWHTFQN